MVTAYRDGWWQSADGLRLHYREYASADGHAPARPPILCLPGLTRNARDFAKPAQRLAARGWRVLCVELRGRGQSQYAADPMSYTAQTYVADLRALLAQAQIARFVAFGTSLGGLMTMALALEAPELIAGALINDVGPELMGEGLMRIGAALGLDPRYADWSAAVAAHKAQSGMIFPGRSEESWLASARRLMVEDPDGTIRYDYDPAIAVPFGQPVAPLPDLWPGWQALSGPVALLRGELSDLLSVECFAEMGRRLPHADCVSVAGVGHTPALDEPEAEAAIDRLLARLDAGIAGQTA